MKILAFSDLHLSRRHAGDVVRRSADADLVIGAGDFCNGRHGLDEAMEMLWTFEDKAVFVPGNAESADELRAATSAPVLHGEALTIAGLRLFGLGYGVPVTPFGAWSCDLPEDTAAAMLAPMRDVDILITHAPPKGVADTNSAGRSLGSTAIRDAIARAQPTLALCGHIHDSWGKSGQIGTTRVHNLGPTVTWFEV